MLRAKRFGGDWIVDTGFRTQWCHFIWILTLLYFQDDVFLDVDTETKTSRPRLPQGMDEGNGMVELL